jgi:hypothetical protein
VRGPASSCYYRRDDLVDHDHFARALVLDRDDVEHPDGISWPEHDRLADVHPISACGVAGFAAVLIVELVAEEGWRLRRQAAIDRSGGFCEDCGSREKLDVHHRTYKRKGAEGASDLVALCRRCHGERHRGKRIVPDVIALALLRRWRIWRYRRTAVQERG